MRRDSRRAALLNAARAMVDLSRHSQLRTSGAASHTRAVNHMSWRGECKNDDYSQPINEAV
ncbi:hypothetical protein [Paenibacillus plantiphilus]|uniref:hypothetical protein n=1 Tax=Paenibacillus plantiphilus TaxID=2905650 RepID=UPI001F450BFC|nr:hypothetical protein [Paenibacillus plantiphilus]